MEIKIKNREELNGAASRLRAHSVQMCNDINTDDVTKNFIIAKDLLIAIYKYNVERLSKND